LEKFKVPGAGVAAGVFYDGNTETVPDEGFSTYSVRQHLQPGQSRDQCDSQTHISAICLAVNESELPKLGPCMRAMSTRKDHTPYHCTRRKVRDNIQKVPSPAYHHDADVGRKKILSHMRRSFYAMASGVSDERLRGEDGGQSLIRRMDLPIRNTSPNHHRSGMPVRVTSLPSAE